MSAESNSGEPVIAGDYDNYKETQAEIFAHESRRTRNCLFWIAVILFVNDLISLAIADLLIPKLILASLLFPAIYFALGLLAMTQSLVSIIIGMVVFAVIVILTFVKYGSASALMGWIVKALMIYFLLAGFQSARTAEQSRKEMS